MTTCESHWLGEYAAPVWLCMVDGIEMTSSLDKNVLFSWAFLCVEVNPSRGAVFVKKTLRPRWPQKASEVKTMHTIRKGIKSYLLGAQVSELSEKIEELFKILCKFGPVIGPPSYKFGLFWSFCTTVALSGGQICKQSWITSRFSQTMQKLWLLTSNFWCSFVRCALFGPWKLFEVTEVIMSFS